MISRLCHRLIQAPAWLSRGLYLGRCPTAPARIVPHTRISTYYPGSVIHATAWLPD